ncbi:MAG TPA: hypothetical protein VFZ61_23515, partial [Polyangiales bacterium]
WLVLVDDLDSADEFSAALVAALAAMAETLPLLVVASAQADAACEESAPLGAFLPRARRIQLAELDEKHTRSLVSNVFGRVPNRERLVSFLYRTAHGNPALTLELCRYLLERGQIRYVDGIFVLPEGEIQEELPAGTALSLSLRLAGLSAVARDLADLVATCRGGASLELCLAASELGGEEVIGGVNELVSRGVLMGSGQDLVFAQEALRSGVSLAIPPAEKRGLHERLASAYLRTPGAGSLHLLEAAWHMVHTPHKEREGAELLVRITPPLIEAGVAYRAAVEGAEKALEVLERLGAPLWQRLDIRVVLARASYLYDYRLAKRYADETLRALYAWTGMPLVEKWKRLLGQTGCFFACIAIMSFRYVFYGKQRRGPAPITALKHLGRALLSTLGVGMTSLDREAAVQLLRYIWVFRDTPRFTPAWSAYLTAEALAVQPFGREAELAEKLVVARAAVERRLPIDMSDAERQDIRVGLMLSGGINECYRIGSRALELADEITATGTRIAHAAAHRIRFTYFVVRGMREKAEEYRRELDIHGIQGGTTWQVDWFAVPTEGMASALLGDVVGTGDALARMERLARDMPSLEAMRDMVRIGHHMRRGENARAIELGAQFVAAYPPRTVIGWGAAYSAYAAALNHEGRHAEARQLCERALAALTPADLEYVIMYGPLERELALSLAYSGELARALEVADAYIDRLEAKGEIALVAHAHECKVYVARVLRNHDVLMQALVAMRDAAERTASSTVIEQAAKVTQASLRGTRELELPVAAELADEFGSTAPSGETPAGGIARSRKRTLLRRVMERSNARSAFVLTFSDNDGGPRLVASAGDSLAPTSLVGAVRNLVGSLGEPATDRPFEVRARVEVEGRWFEISTLPRTQQEESAVLMALEATVAPEDELPQTLLARL